MSLLKATLCSHIPSITVNKSAKVIGLFRRQSLKLTPCREWLPHTAVRTDPEEGHSIWSRLVRLHLSDVVKALVTHPLFLSESPENPLPHVLLKLLIQFLCSFGLHQTSFHLCHTASCWDKVVNSFSVWVLNESAVTHFSCSCLAGACSRFFCIQCCP